MKAKLNNEEAGLVSTSARVLAEPGSPSFVLIQNLAYHYSKTVREVYRRVVVRQELWFAKGGAGVRTELIARGWSKREADSMLVTAQAAQTAAIELAKLDLIKSRQLLVDVNKKITKNNKTWQTSKKPKPQGLLGDIELARIKKQSAEAKRHHGLVRRQQILTAKVKRLEFKLANHKIRVTFGTKKLARGGNDPKLHGFDTHRVWKDAWQQARSNIWFCQGDKGDFGGNLSGQVQLVENKTMLNGECPLGDTVRVRIPQFLQPLNAGLPHVIIPVKGFQNHRESLLKAQERSKVSHINLRGERVYNMVTANPVSLRLHWSAKQSHWYATATFQETLTSSAPEFRSRPCLGAILGVDINPDNLSWCIATKDGNPLRFGKIAYHLTGNQDQNSDKIGLAVKQLCELTLAEGVKTIAHEDLDFQKATKSLRYDYQGKTAKTLSSFAYNKIITTLLARSRRVGLLTIAVNPAFSSVLGQVNYAGVYGVSVDQAASCVIARSGLGLVTSPRRDSLRKLDVTIKKKTGSTVFVPTCEQSRQVQLRKLHKALFSNAHAKGRRTTWSNTGLCLRKVNTQLVAQSAKAPISVAVRTASKLPLSLRQRDPELTARGDIALLTNVGECRQ